MRAVHLKQEYLALALAIEMSLVYLSHAVYQKGHCQEKLNEPWHNLNNHSAAS